MKLKCFVILLIGLLISTGLFAQQQKKYSTFYYQRATLFEQLPVGKKDIIFLGNSITNGGEWSELFNNKHVKNRGISGDITQGVLDRLDPIVIGKPAKVFLLIGTNDLTRNVTADQVINNIELIIKRFAKESPKTKVYIQSILPVNPVFNMFGGHTKNGARLPEINARIKSMTEKNGATYIDLYKHFLDAEGNMDVKYTNDGLHLTGPGYILWRDIVKEYVK
ncbi:MAG: GDSL-type esterase/lipase family protein [Marinifilaceae bacterium]